MSIPKPSNDWRNDPNFIDMTTSEMGMLEYSKSLQENSRRVPKTTYELEDVERERKKLHKVGQKMTASYFDDEHIICHDSRVPALAIRPVENVPFQPTPNMKKILAVLADEDNMLGQKEIKERAGISSKNGLTNYLIKLESNGFIMKHEEVVKGSRGSVTSYKYYLA